MALMNWESLKCRHRCSSAVVAIVHAPQGCWCFPDPIQALCAQHVIKGMQNNDMSTLLTRPGFNAPASQD